MPITSVTKDADALTMTVVAEFDAPLHRLWDAYIDPRQVERFWGPPTYPALFTRHDAYTGGRSEYTMTGPGGDISRGYWEWIEVDAPHRFSVRDGFAEPDGSPAAAMPSMRMVFTFEETQAGSRVTTTTYFASADDLERLLGMGMQEGMTEAMSQMDAVIADLISFASDDGTVTQLLDDTRVRISRVIRGDRDAVWHAYNDPELIRRWMLGPDGWIMSRCEVTDRVGGSFHYQWVREDGEDGFGFTGELLDFSAPYRSVTTERMAGTDGPSTVNELTLTPVADGTLLSLLITYPDAATRDTVLATGMADGMEASYARLETLLDG